jgi:hypothetical protein
VQLTAEAATRRGEPDRNDSRDAHPITVARMPRDPEPIPRN